MPYNTTAIPRRSEKEPTGTTQLPLSRVKKMMQVDQDINASSSAASFVITLATEMFVQYLAEQAHNVVRSERKPRRNIQYRDLAHAVARNDNLEFLSDVVPQTVPYKAVKEKQVAKGAALNGESSIEAGQTTLDGKKPTLNGTNGISGSVGDDDDDPNAQLEMESRGAGNRTSAGSAGAFSGKETSQDVEMD
ncbi:uncharacterized protein LY89DRAFT_734268 [Mollisia scopiformis]|uniref:Transcription factor CBF/NF-Y/archaeal histone domain-containing protein n=1 Tax=Mollisia scopiformis TaxID=149040 RepID=A0A194X7S0_MOLSC|nr:uncharacterized protein LY89DRAFT_734268 [Mollisia scopiformis]KUJ16149.1 hypothetical protein LY89DRAFT_734268 [Mollisia scopiformis]